MTVITSPNRLFVPQESYMQQVLDHNDLGLSHAIMASLCTTISLKRLHFVQDE